MKHEERSDHSTRTHLRTHTKWYNQNLTIPYTETACYISDSRRQKSKVHRRP